MYSKWHSAKQFYPCIGAAGRGGGSLGSWAWTGPRWRGMSVSRPTTPRRQMQPAPIGSERWQLKSNAASAHRLGNTR